MNPVALAKTALLLLIDYFRWTQLTPMVMAWAGLLGVLVVFAFANFQAEGMAVLESIADLWGRYAWLPRFEDPGTTDDEGVWRIDSERLRRPVLLAWAMLALFLWVLGGIWSRVFGVRRRRPLKRQLQLALVVAAAVWCAFVALYVLSSETFQGSATRWLFTFAALCLLPVLASVYSLVVANLLHHVADRLTRWVPIKGMI